MVVCRVNAPIITLVFSLLKRNIVANIQGRDIGQNLIALIKKLGGETLADMLTNLETYEATENIKLSKLRYGADEKMVALQDKCDCIRIMADGFQTIDQVISKIEELFKDSKDKNAILLSSVHRSKGLEADKVYIIRPDLLPHPKLVEKSMGEQEFNLHYVAITRAIKNLIYVG
jgi:superfamily I DNA/RNA helicase